jgi:hypothetical protein
MDADHQHPRGVTPLAGIRERQGEWQSLYYGSPGSSDTIGITLWNGTGGIWFSTNWVGSPPATVKKLAWRRQPGRPLN